MGASAAILRGGFVGGGPGFYGGSPTCLGVGAHAAEHMLINPHRAQVDVRLNLGVSMANS